MNKSSLLFLTFPLLLLSCQSNRQENTETDYTQYVNPFIGTQENGHTFPGACMPFGMIQASPETGAIGWRYCSGYNNEDKHIIGFAQTHLNGTGCLDFGDILIQPVTGRRIRSDYKSSFDKANETATPGYYSVILSDYGVKAEITATHRTSMYRFTYDRADSASMLIDLQHGLSWNENQYHTQIQKCETEWENDSTLTGEVWSQVWVPQRLYFVMTFDRPKTELITLPKAEGEKGDRYIASFDMKNGDCLNVKIAISGVSIDGAKKNFAAESAGKTFEEIRENAKDVWNQYLSKIEITGSKDRKESFYTSMYHLFIQPSDIADVDGMYRGANDSVYQAKAGEYYSTFSTWDTYRAAHPLYTIIAPEAVDGFVNSMIAHTDVQGFLPIWALWGKESYIMVANHAVPVVVEAYRKGYDIVNKPVEEGGMWNGRYYCQLWKNGSVNDKLLEDQTIGILFDVVPRDKALKIIESLNEMSLTPYGVAETFPYYPKEFGLDPATYHNGAVWPWVNFMDCWARIRLGQKDDAIDIIKRVGRADIIASGDWSANEHINSLTGENLGFHIQGWSAALFGTVYFGLVNPDIVP